MHWLVTVLNAAGYRQVLPGRALGKVAAARHGSGSTGPVDRPQACPGPPQAPNAGSTPSLDPLIGIQLALG